MTGNSARDEALASARRQRLWLFGAIAVVAAALVIVAIAVSGSSDSGTTTGPPRHVAQVVSRFAGIPQRGPVLGSPAAKVTVEEFADVQCPFCAEAARGPVGDVVRDYVRSGRARIVFRPLAFIGPDSVKGARLVAAAALQNRLWQFVDLVYHNQGEENSGWVSDAYLRRIGAAIGLDVGRAFAVRTSAGVTALLEQARLAAKAANVKSTPSFLVSAPGHTPQLTTDAGSLRGAIDKALAGG